jgi:micrococcal nuclease
MIAVLACIPVQGPTGDESAETETATEQDTGPTEQERDDERVRALTDLPAGDPACSAPILARVNHTVDGDTLWAQPEDGGVELEIRLIGLDTPEIDHGDGGGECYGDDASAFTDGELTDNLVWLTFDLDCTDDYGRALAYLFRDDTDEGFFNRRLLRGGYATVYTFEPNTAFVDDFQDDEDAARNDGAGLWSACTD